MPVPPDSGLEPSLIISSRRMSHPNYELDPLLFLRLCKDDQPIAHLDYIFVNSSGGVQNVQIKRRSLR